ncbi:MAG: hypothetical protein AB8G99_13155 [Planctomycetaceae bacterium]
MLKKAIIGVLSLTLVAGIMLGSDASSYFRTMKKRAHEAVKSEMDLDFEVDRARTMIEDLVPAIEDCQEVVIKQQVELSRKEVSVAKLEEALDARQGEILALRDDLKTGKDKFRYASISYTRTDVERDLKIRMDRYKGAVAALNRDKKIMVAQRDKLRANQQMLENMVGQKKELEVAVAQLEARLEQIEAQEAISTLTIDDSQLSQVKGLIQELNNQMDVKVKMLDAEGNYTGLIPVGQDNEVQDRDIASEVDAYFGSESKAEGDDSAI